MNIKNIKRPKNVTRALSALAIAALFVGGFASLAATSNVYADSAPTLSGVGVTPDSGSITAGQSADVFFREASNATDLTVAGTCQVNGVNVGSTFQNLTDGLYKVVYTVGSGDQERQGGSLPVNCTLGNGNGTVTASAWSDSNTLAIDTNNNGTIEIGTGGGTGTTTSGFQVSAMPASGTLSNGNNLEVYFQDTASSPTTDYTAGGTCQVNGVNVGSTFQNLTDGLYKVTYTVGSSDTDRAAGQVPVDCTIQNQSSSIHIAAFSDGNTVAINADNSTGSSTGGGTGTTTSSGGGSGTTTPPASNPWLVSGVGIVPNSGILTVGQSADIYFNASSSAADLTLGGACTVNSSNVASTFQNLTGGLYKVVYHVGSGDMARGAGLIPISCIFQNGAGATSSVMAFTDSNTLAIDTANSTSTTGGGTGTTTSSGGTGTSTSDGALGGTVSGGADASLGVTTIDQVDSTATAGGGFSNGWVWVFHVTVPSGEDMLSMKFRNWKHSNGIDNIPVANNMRISSAQANSSSTVMLTASDTYSSPLTLTGDMDSNTPGRQVEIRVEMQVPANAINGSYTSDYGIRTE